MRILSGDYLFNTPTQSPSGYFAALTALLAILFIVCAVLYVRRAKFAPQNPVLRRLFRRTATAGMWTAGTGLFLALMRYAGVDYLADPILMLLLLLIMIFLAGYYVYDLSERYPSAVWKLQESHIERRYRPISRARPEPQRPRPKVRGKRRR